MIHRQATVLSVLSGVLVMLGFSPIHCWPSALIGMAYCVHITTHPPKKAGQLGYSFGLGLFGSGVYWVMYSVHDYGHNNWPVSIAITLLLIGYLSLYPALVTYLTSMDKSRYKPCSFIALWVATEYIRSHLATGFPWLLIGYTQTLGPLHTLAPYIGVFGLSALVTLFAYWVHHLCQQRTLKRCLGHLIAQVIVLSVISGHHSHWTHNRPSHLKVAMVQGNIMDKWGTPLSKQINHYLALSPTKDAKIILWPEAALPVSDWMIPETLKNLHNHFAQHHQILATGLIHAHQGKWYNSIRLMGMGHGLITKRHLVPFGEYVPSFLQPITAFLPQGMGALSQGNTNQATVFFNQTPITALICYEVAYPELVRQLSHQHELIVIFNDSHWFGPSFAASQQLEMAAMRAKELQKPVLYVSNTGWTAHFDHQGKLLSHLPMNQPGTLMASVSPYHGETPYSHYGLLMPTALLAACYLALRLYLQRKHLKTLLFG